VNLTQKYLPFFVSATKVRALSYLMAEYVTVKSS